MGSFWFEYEEDGNVQTFSFDGENVSIGREQSSDFVLDHPTVSRQHAIVVDDGGGEFRLVVLSRGGLTAIDGDRIQGEARLYDGSELYFGELKFRFRSDDAPLKSEGRASGGAQQPQQPQQVSPAGGAAPSAETAGDGSPAQNLAASVDEEGSGASNTASSSARAGIESWDEIAESAVDEEEEAPDPQSQGGSAQSSFGQPSQASAEGGSQPEQTDPKIVILGIVGSIALLAYSFWPGANTSTTSGGDPLQKKGPSVKIEVQCLSNAECLKGAKETYEVGTEWLEKSDTEIGNLFLGYKRLLEARTYVEKSNRDSPPPEMKKLGAKIEAARKELDKIFRNYRVKYRSAKKNGQYDEMAEALNTIQEYFPDKTAREHRWARSRILRMKDQGNYPGGY